MNQAYENNKNNNSDCYFVNQATHNVYNVYNNYDNANLFDNVPNTQNQYHLQQDVYANQGGFQQHALYPFDNKASDNLLYDCTLVNDNFLYEYNKQSIVPDTYKVDSYPVLSESFLQDDNFSIATVSDFNNLSSHAITPLSTPSPQLSDLNSNYSNSQFIQPLYQSVNDNFLFAPIEEALYHHQSNLMTDSKKSKCPADTEKKHICPICNHRYVWHKV